MDAEGPDVSPTRAVLSELQALRDEFRSALLAYSVRIEQEIASVEAAAELLSRRKKISSSQLRDVRDMLTLLRKFSIKPEKGRRKDLKKIDSLIDDLLMLTENWARE